MILQRKPRLAVVIFFRDLDFMRVVRDTLCNIGHAVHATKDELSVYPCVKKERG